MGAAEAAERRQAGLGTVTELGPKRFWARGPRPKRISLGVYPTYEEADDVRKAAVQELANADRTHAPGVSLREYGERRLEEMEMDGTPAIANYRSRWNHILKAPFIDDPMDCIHRVSVHRWIKELKKAKVRRGGGPGAKVRTISRTHVRAIVGFLVQVYKAAMEEGLVQDNPALGHRIKGKPKDEDEAEVWTYLEPQEQQAVLACKDTPEADRLMIAAAIGTGCRLGELTNLELRDVHLEGDRPYITIRWGSKGRKPKNGKVRTVPLFGIGLAAFQRWLEVLPTWAKKNPERLVFPTKHGSRRRRSQHLQHGYRRRSDGFREALIAAGITRRVRWHDLRHTCASSLVAGWWGPAWSLEEVRDVLGHTTSRITERYAHFAPAVIAAKAARTPGLGYGVGYDAPAAVLALPAKSSSDRMPMPVEWRGSSRSTTAAPPISSSA
jgi:integrase